MMHHSMPMTLHDSIYGPFGQHVNQVGYLIVGAGVFTRLLRSISVCKIRSASIARMTED